MKKTIIVAYGVFLETLGKCWDGNIPNNVAYVDDVQGRKVAMFSGFKETCDFVCDSFCEDLSGQELDNIVRWFAIEKKVFEKLKGGKL